MFGGMYKMDNMCVIVDYNRIQLDGFVKDILDLEPFIDKWKSFDLHVIEIDGHDIPAIQRGFAEAAVTKGKASVIVAHTIKGKGVSFMENSVLWHYRTARGAEFDAALAELTATASN